MFVNPRPDLTNRQKDEHGHSKALKPANEKLWHMLSIQARAKFTKYPSPAASAWIHKEYVRMGGKFLDPEQEKRKKALLKRHEKNKKKVSGDKDD